MRRSNWKAKALVVMAVCVGLAAGALAAALVPEAYEAFKGVLAVCVGGLSTIAAVYAGAKMLRIGGD